MDRGAARPARADWVNGRALVVFGTQLTKITRKCARGRERLGIINRQLPPGTRLLQHANLAAMRLNMSQRHCLGVARIQSKRHCTVQLVLPATPQPSTFQGADKPQAPHWLRLSELLGASGRPRRLIGSTPQQALRHVTEKGRLLPETGLRHFWDGANASFYDWSHPQITQINARLLIKRKKTRAS